TVLIQRDGNEISNPKKSRPCFYSQIGLCTGACAGKGDWTSYQSNITNIEKYFKGQKHEIILGMERQMKAVAKDQNFEEAARLRNMIRDLQYVGSNLHIDNDIDESLVLSKKQEKREAALSDLMKYLSLENTLKSKLPHRIECYDISNIQGKFAVGS